MKEIEKRLNPHPLEYKPIKDEPLNEAFFEATREELETDYALFRVRNALRRIEERGGEHD